MPISHNATISRLLKDSYSPQEIEDIFSLLRQNNTFSFPALSNGLFPAANLQEEAKYTGYSYVWVRDNVYVAYSHAMNNHTAVALKTVRTLMQYFIRHRWRFERIIAGELDHQIPMNRPHIRFNGEDLSEVKEKWAHAEDDALGYFLWLFCKLTAELQEPLRAEE